MFNYLFITTKWFSDDGGIQTVNRKLCIELAKRNKVAVLVADAGRPNEDELEDAKKSKITLHKRDELVSLLSDNKFDFICTHSTFTGSFIEIIKQMNFENKDVVKFIHFIHHDPEDVEDIKEEAENRQEKRNSKKTNEVVIANKADCVITIGESLKHIYVNEVSVLEYIDVGMADMVKHSYRNTKAPKVLISGRTSSLSVKGIDIFAKAAEKVTELIKDTNLEKVTFTVRGESGDLDKFQVKLQEISAKNINFNIKEYTTNQNELDEDLKKSAVFVVPSRVEGYGLVAMEAISMGVPTIISSKSGVASCIKQVVNDTKLEENMSDFIWDFGESNAHINNLAEKIIDILKSQESKREYVANYLVPNLMKKASWKTGAKKIEDICEKLLGIELMKNEEQGIQLFMKRIDPYLRLYDYALENANENIQITSIKLKKLRTKQKQMLLEKSQTVKIEILLLDPRFPIPDEPNSIAAIREKAESLKSGEIKDEVAEWLKVWKEYEKDYKRDAQSNAGLEIKLFRSLPTVNMIRTDSKMFVGTFLLTKESNERQPTFIVENKPNTMGEKLFTSYLEHFDNLKNKSVFINNKDFCKWINK
jgi:glycosyltransferase involved in cell wall biosynthesis